MNVETATEFWYHATMDQSKDDVALNFGFLRPAIAPETRLTWFLKIPDVLQMSPEEFASEHPGHDFASLIDPPLPDPAAQKWAVATQKLLRNYDEIERCMRLHRSGKHLETGLKWIAIQKYKCEKNRRQLESRAINTDDSA
jgi:hypothetical protein